MELSLVSSLVIGGISLLFQHRGQIRTSIKEDFEKGRKNEYLKKLSNPKFLKYYNDYLTELLAILQKHLGLPFSNRANNFTTNLAVFYSFAVFLIIWIFSGSGKLANIIILDESIIAPFRISLMVLSLLFIYLSFIYLNKNRYPIFRKRHYSIALRVFVFLPYFCVAVVLPTEWVLGVIYPSWIKTTIIILFSSSLGGFILNRAFLQKSGATIFAITFIILVFGSAVFSTFFQINNNLLQFAVMLAIFICLSLAVYFVNYKIGAEKVYFINILMIGLYLFISKYYPAVLGMDVVSAILLYFFVLLPSLNGLMDWISLAISRLLAKQIIAQNNVKILLGAILLDILAAVGLMAALIFIFISGTKLFNILVVSGRPYEIPIKELIEAARLHPFSREGLWVVVMLFSTLIPTFVHFFIAVTAVCFKFPFQNTKKNLLHEIKQKNYSSACIDKLAWYLASINIVSILATVTFTCFIIYLIHPYFLDLIYSLALFSYNII